MDAKKYAYLRKYMNERYHNDPEFRKRVIAYTKKSQMKYPFRTWANGVIQGHHKRGFQTEITRPKLEELASKSPFCVFCGCTLKYGRTQDGKKKWHHDSASADRVDNTKSLSEKNIQIICVQCNSAKAKMSTTEFKEWIGKVHAYFVD